jgi:hypothetical protein
MVGVQTQMEARSFTPIWTGSGAHPSPYSAKVEERIALYLYFPPHAFMAYYRVNFTIFYLYLLLNYFTFDFQAN